MIAGVYARKSNKEQEGRKEDKSVEQQITEARRFADKRGWKIREDMIFVDDARSGKRLVKESQRPALAKLRAAVEGKKVGAILVWMRDRLGRDMIDRLVLIREIEDAGVEIWATEDGSRITLGGESDGGAKIKEVITGFVDEEQRKNTGKNIHRTQRQKAERGLHNGSMVYGYDLAPTGEINKHGRAVRVRKINEAQAKVVRLIFDLRVRGWAAIAIARFLNGVPIVHDGKKHQRAAVPSPRAGRKVGMAGKRADERITAVNSGKWSAPGVCGIMRNPLYMGDVVWTNRKVKPPETITFHDDNLVIVEPKLWREVQRLNAKDKKIGLRRPNGQVFVRISGKDWITKVFRCGLCENGPMRLDKRDRHWYLRCSGAAGHGKRLNVEDATEHLVETFPAVLKPAAIVREVQRWIATRREAKADGKTDRAAVARYIAELDRDIKTAVAKSVKTRDEKMAEAYEREAEGLMLLKRTEEAKLQGTDVLREFDAGELADALEAVTKGWDKHLERDPGIIAQVLSKVLRMKIAVVPVEGGGWKYEDVEVDYLPVIREADEDLARVIESFTREMGSTVAEVKARGKSARTDRRRCARG